MPTVALAFMNNGDGETRSLLAAAPAAGGETRPTSCSKCSLVFAIVFVNRTDREQRAVR